ncbi:hypothetical protein FRC20_011216 [Serendipita sp. 405]|nr:hypothetical protein FRC20_011216 [Serendipita sp. 405]
MNLVYCILYMANASRQGIPSSELGMTKARKEWTEKMRSQDRFGTSGSSNRRNRDLLRRSSQFDGMFPNGFFNLVSHVRIMSNLVSSVIDLMSTRRPGRRGSPHPPPHDLWERSQIKKMKKVIKYGQPQDLGERTCAHSSGFMRAKRNSGVRYFTPGNDVVIGVVTTPGNI